jgi:hypothetical protein
VPPPPRSTTKNGLSRNHLEHDINFDNYTPEEEILVEPTSTGEEFNGNRQPPRPSNKAAKRKSVAENWVAAEKRLVDISLAIGEIPPCSCRARETIFVRHISCEGMSEWFACLILSVLIDVTVFSV